MWTGESSSLCERDIADQSRGRRASWASKIAERLGGGKIGLSILGRKEVCASARSLPLP